MEGGDHRAVDTKHKPYASENHEQRDADVDSSYSVTTYAMTNEYSVKKRDCADG